MEATRKDQTAAAVVVVVVVSVILNEDVVYKARLLLRMKENTASVSTTFALHGDGQRRGCQISEPVHMDFGNCARQFALLRRD